VRQREQREREDRLAALFRRDYTAPKRQKPAGDDPPRSDAPSPTPIQENIRKLQQAVEIVTGRH
jgi:hypothetical protein